MGVPTEERLRRYAREKAIEDAGDKVAVIEVCFPENSGRSVEASGTSAYSHKRKSGVPSPYCQPGTPVMSGSSWAMPLWQSMQVFSPLTRNFSCALAARGLCRVKSM